MTALATQMPSIAKQVKPKRPITLEAFQRYYANKEDGYRYEWNKGIVEKTPRLSMNRSQLEIVHRLSRLFMPTMAFKALGELEREVIMFLPKANRNRIADLAYLTNTQLKEKNDLYPSVSSFVIEIISKNDKANEIQEKLEEYFADGVQVVWQIFPNQQTIHVYTSPIDIKICKGTVICSAAPALPDFNITAQDVFA